MCEVHTHFFDLNVGTPSKPLVLGMMRYLHDDNPPHQL